jgi:uncharacterized protein (DUF924 family)
MEIVERVLDFWFLSPGDGGEEPHRNEWFKSTPELDRETERLFTEDTRKAAAGGYDALGETAQGSLALVILLDQFPRNLYRGSAQAFASDGKALDVAKRAIERGFDRGLGRWRRMFLYLPFQHSEDLAVQSRSLELFNDLGEENTLGYAKEHYDIIARFGRFPHRNAVLGRSSTAEEDAFLKEFSSF